MANCSINWPLTESCSGHGQCLEVATPSQATVFHGLGEFRCVCDRGYGQSDFIAIPGTDCSVDLFAVRILYGLVFAAWMMVFAYQATVCKFVLVNEVPYQSKQFHALGFSLCFMIAAFIRLRDPGNALLGMDPAFSITFCAGMAWFWKFIASVVNIMLGKLKKKPHRLIQITPRFVFVPCLAPLLGLFVPELYITFLRLHYLGISVVGVAVCGYIGLLYGREEVKQLTKATSNVKNDELLLERLKKRLKLFQVLVGEAYRQVGTNLVFSILVSYWPFLAHRATYLLAGVWIACAPFSYMVLRLFPVRDKQQKHGRSRTHLLSEIAPNAAAAGAGSAQKARSGKNVKKNMSTTGTMSRADRMEEDLEEVLVELPDKDKRLGRWEFVKVSAFLLTEIFEMVLLILNFASYANAESLNNAYGILYSFSTGSIMLWGFGIIVQYGSELVSLRRELSKGIFLDRARARQVRQQTYSTRSRGQSMDRGKIFPENILNQSPGDHPDHLKKEDSLSIPEYRLRILSRDLHKAKRAIMGAFVEDLVVIAFSLYRTFYTNAHFTSDFVYCLTSIQEETEVPAKCMENEMLLVYLQVLIATSSFALKLSYVRDYYRVKAHVAEKLQELIREKNSTSTTLDLFQGGQVEDDEIEQIVTIRNVVEPYRDSLLPGIITDLHLLRVLRRISHFDAKEVVMEAIHVIRSCLTSREKHGADHTRKKIFLNDLSLEKLPHISKFLDLGVKISFTQNFDHHTFDVEVVTPRKVGSDHEEESSKSDSVMDACKKRLFFKEEHDIHESLVFLSEWVLGVLDHFSNDDGIVYGLRMIWKLHSTQDEELVKSLLGGSTWKDKYKDIFLLLPEVNHIFVDPREEMMVDTEGENQNTARIRNFGLDTTMSSFRNQRATGLMFFKGITEAELSKMTLVASYLRSCQRAAIKHLKKGQLEGYIVNLQGYLQEAESMLFESGDSAYKTRLDKLQTQLNISKLVNRGIKLEDFPREVVGDLALWRFLSKSVTLDIHETANKFSTTLVWREDNGVNLLNQKIKEEDLSIDDIGKYAQYRKAIGGSPFLALDKERGHTVVWYTFDCYALVEDMIKEFNASDPMWGENYMTYTMEYYLIMLDNWSYYFEKPIKFSCMATLGPPMLRHMTTISKFHSDMIRVGKHYPNLQRLPFLGLSKGQSAAQEFAISLGTRDAARLRTIMIASESGKRKLNTFIDIELLPPSFFEDIQQRFAKADSDVNGQSFKMQSCRLKASSLLHVRPEQNYEEDDHLLSRPFMATSAFSQFQPSHSLSIFQLPRGSTLGLFDHSS